MNRKTWIGHKVSKYRRNMRLFVRNFWRNWIVFLLLLTVQLSFPPVPCYFKDGDGNVKYTLTPDKGEKGAEVKVSRV